MYKITLPGPVLFEETEGGNVCAVIQSPDDPSFGLTRGFMGRRPFPPQTTTSPPAAMVQQIADLGFTLDGSFSFTPFEDITTSEGFKTEVLKVRHRHQGDDHFKRASLRWEVLRLSRERPGRKGRRRTFEADRQELGRRWARIFWRSVWSVGSSILDGCNNWVADRELEESARSFGWTWGLPDGPVDYSHFIFLRSDLDFFELVALAHRLGWSFSDADFFKRFCPEGQGPKEVAMLGENRMTHTVTKQIAAPLGKDLPSWSRLLTYELTGPGITGAFVRTIAEGSPQYPLVHFEFTEDPNHEPTVEEMWLGTTPGTGHAMISFPFPPYPTAQAQNLEREVVGYMEREVFKLLGIEVDVPVPWKNYTTQKEEQLTAYKESVATGERDRDVRKVEKMILELEKIADMRKERLSSTA